MTEQGKDDARVGEKSRLIAMTNSMKRVINNTTDGVNEDDTVIIRPDQITHSRDEKVQLDLTGKKNNSKQS